jgi:peptidoglycan/LPS O-acetylase OafA/YrhL
VRFDLLIVVGFVLPLFRPAAPFAFPVFSLLAAVAMERLMTGKWSLPESRIFKPVWSHLCFLGVVSYSFYLFHQPIVRLTGRVLAALFPAAVISPALKLLICLGWYPIVLALSYALYRLVEQPCIRMGKRIGAALQRHRSV